MLAELSQERDIDVMCDEEDTESVLDYIWGYTAYTNLVTTRRRTAFIARNHLELQDITCLPSDIGIAAGMNGVWVVI
jgi:hypothetical protein